MSKKKKKNRFQLRDLRDALAQMRRLAPYAFPYWPRMIFFLLCVGLFWAGNLARYWVVGDILRIFMNPDDTLGAGDEAAISDFFLSGETGFVALVLAVSGVAMALGMWGKQYLSAWLFQRATVDVQRDLALSIMDQPISFFNKARKGELMSRVTNDLGGTRMTFQILYSEIISHTVGIAVMLSALVASSHLLFLGVLVLPVVLSPVLFLTSKIKRVSKQSYEKAAELTNFFHQYFEGIRVVKAFSLEEQQAKDLERSADGYFTHSVKIGKYKGLSKALTEMALGFLLAIAIVVGAMLISGEFMGASIDFPTLGQFIAIMVALYDPVRRLASTLNNMSQSLAANERVFELMDREPEERDHPGAVPAPAFSQAIEFKDLSFEYEAGRPVLQEINFTAPKGSMTALVGATGSGKSTLLDLIPRFYEPTAGHITIDGVDLAGVKQASWLAQIAVVAQETFLFNTTIRENLTAARHDATDDELWEALEAANIAAEIRALPEGLSTTLGDRGVNLSGGQRQRLAIARAFVKRAPVLLLDEATSALDTETERKVQAALDKLIEGATVFAIAHRLSTIMHADQILVLDQGRIVERGTHQELLEASGRYALLYKTQVSGAG